MPRSGYKSVTIPEQAYALAKMLVNLGLEESIGKAVANAMKEYVSRREQLIREVKAVRQKFSHLSKEGI